METQPLHTEDLTLGNVEYHFRAFHVQGYLAQFNFHSFRFQRGQEPDMHENGHQDFCFWHPMGDLIGFGPRRQQIIYGMMSSIPSLSDSETLNFWKDHVSTYSCETALMRFLGHNSLYSLSRGAIKFVIEFHVHVAPVLPLHQPRVFGVEMVDGVFIVIGEPRTGPSRAAEASSSAAIKNLERLKYGDGAQFREKECTICLVDFESEGDDLSRMPCSHTFHYRCLARWLKRSLSCPFCRYEINVAAEGESRRMIL